MYAVRKKKTLEFGNVWLKTGQDDKSRYVLIKRGLWTPSRGRGKLWKAEVGQFQGGRQTGPRAESTKDPLLYERQTGDWMRCAALRCKAKHSSAVCLCQKVVAEPKIVGDVASAT
jgi:hypothetical protein